MADNTSPQTSDNLLTSIGIPLLVYIQKSGSVLPETHQRWIKNNFDVKPEELPALYGKIIDILLEQNLVRESPLSSGSGSGAGRLYCIGIPGQKRIAGITERGYELIQPYCIERDAELAQIIKDRPYSSGGVKKPMKKVRGDEGELKTLRLLQETVFPKYCRYVMNAVIHTEYTKPNGTVKKRRTEIDILFICTSGIIVIENKELHGILNGSGSEPQWRFTPKGKTNAVKIINPAAQNRDHITVLNSIYNVRKKLYHSIAVVPRYTQIKVKSGIRKNEHLIHRNELIPTIMKIMNTGEDIWTNEEVNNMIEKVLNQ
ncbi:MAG TPA: nuclease-related domain-containing protein [Methanocorpusculum sp.]|nr:nuclease-related domain-containing protein [Methanocorpusculum sp.]